MSHTGYADDCSDDQCELEEQLNLNSPRLLKACKKQGIEPHELLKKSIVDIREMYKRDNLNKTGIMLAAQHYEERRLEKLRIVMKERTRMLDEEEDWAYVPYNQKRSDLHMAKGRTTEYAPKNDEAKRRKERKQLGEMLIDQQAEMDRFIQEGGDPFAGMGDYQRRLAHTRAKEAQLERKQVDDNDIEVIGDGEYQYDAIGNQGIQLLKRKGEKQKMTGQQRRNKQKLVYKREIEHFNKNEKATREREKKAREYTLRKKTEGMLLENRVIYAHPHRREKMSIKEKAMKDYLVEQLKMQEEDDRRIRRDKETVVQVAKRESKKWFDRQQLDIKKGMGVYEERTKEFGPNFRKAVKAAQRDPAMYSRLIQNSLFEPKDKPEKFKHDYNSDDSVSARGDDEWEDVGYAKGRSPVGGASMMTTKTSWNRLGGENRKSIYDVTGWKKLTEIEAIGNRVKQAGMQSSVSSEFVKRSPQERRQPVKVTYDAEESGDDAWEEDAYKGFKSPGKSTASKSNWSQTRSPQRRDKTIYEVTGWKRINEPETAKKSKLKTGHSSITSEFVRNTPAEIKEKAKHYDGDETDSDWEINLNRAASTKGFASQQSSPNKQYYGKTIYDITGWKKLDDGEVPARGSYKNGQSSISARFVENEGDFLRKPSFKPAPDRFGRNKFDEETEELEKVHLDRAIKVAQLEKEHELKSLKQYEKEWEVQRGVTFGAFDKKEKRYVEKLLDTKRSMDKYQLHEMLGQEYEVY